MAGPAPKLRRQIETPVSFLPTRQEDKSYRPSSISQCNYMSQVAE
jgi:hypothetical protein